MTTHLPIHTDESTHCNFSCNIAGNLKTHIKKHTGEQLHHCNQCEYKTKQSGPIHKKMHSGEKSQRRTLREYSCITSRDLKRHTMGKHTREKPFKCNQCDNACTSSGNLQQHMRMHTGERPFKCNQCDKTYKWKSHLTPV